MFFRFLYNIFNIFDFKKSNISIGGIVIVVILLVVSWGINSVCFVFGIGLGVLIGFRVIIVIFIWFGIVLIVMFIVGEVFNLIIYNSFCEDLLRVLGLDEWVIM